MPDPSSAIASVAGGSPARIYIDVDDVLAETTRALVQLAARDFGRAVEFDCMTEFDLRQSLSLSDSEYLRFVDAAHEEDQLLGVAAMDGAAFVLAAWREAGATLDIVTGRPPAARDATQRWLDRNEFPYDEIHIVDKYGRFPGEGALLPRDLLEYGYDLVIEDSLEMTHFMLESTRAKVLLVDRPWNRASGELPPGARRVSSWREIRALSAL